MGVLLGNALETQQIRQVRHQARQKRGEWEGSKAARAPQAVLVSSTSLSAPCCLNSFGRVVSLATAGLHSLHVRVASCVLSGGGCELWEGTELL